MLSFSFTGSAGIAYRKLGSGPALVLLHGFPGSGGLWSEIWDTLAEEFTVIIPDLPGTGETPLVGTPGIADMAGMVKEILDKEKIAHTVLAGHSMGGYIALAFATHYPAMVAGISLVHSTTYADDGEKINTRKKAISLIQKGGKQAFVNQMVPNLFSPSSRSAHPDVVARQVTESMKLADESLVNFYNAMIDRPATTSLLSSASFPFQWICGQDDNVIPCEKITGQSHISPINFVSFYNNCGHMSMLEAPALLVKDLSSFTSYCYAVDDGHV